MIDDETNERSYLTAEEARTRFKVQEEIARYIDDLNQAGISYRISTLALLRVFLAYLREAKIAPEGAKEWIIGNWEDINGREW